MAELYQGDLDFGRVALERLAGADLGPHVLVEELSYGAVAVAQRLDELAPRALVLVGAAKRGRSPGTVERRCVRPRAMDPAHVRQAVLEAGTGYVSIDLVLEVCGGLGSLPDENVCFELEPASTEVSERLSPAAEAAIEPALAGVRAELERLQPPDDAGSLASMASDSASSSLPRP